MGVVRPQRILRYNMGQILYRGTHARLRFNEKGFLLTHRSRWYSNPRDYERVMADTSVPMVHPDEWMMVARTLFFELYLVHGTNLINLLHIDSDLVRKLQVSPHAQLPKYGEYYGLVRRGAIVAQERYSWVRTGRPLNDIPKRLIRRFPQLNSSEGFELVKQ